MKSGRGVSDLLGELRGAFATMLSPELADADASAELQFATAAFVVIATVMMLNLLVAMMSETFSTFSSADQGMRQWMLERARMILSIEHVRGGVWDDCGVQCRSPPRASAPGLPHNACTYLPRNANTYPGPVLHSPIGDDRRGARLERREVLDARARWGPEGAARNLSAAQRTSTRPRICVAVCVTHHALSASGAAGV